MSNTSVNVSVVPPAVTVTGTLPLNVPDGVPERTPADESDNPVGSTDPVCTSNVGVVLSDTVTNCERSWFEMAVPDEPVTFSELCENVIVGLPPPPLLELDPDGVS